MSTMRFMTTTATAPSMTTPTTVGRSWLNVAVDREPAEPLDVEDRLGDDRSADEQGDVHAEHRHDRGQARSQRVVDDDPCAPRAPSLARCGCSPPRASRAGCCASSARRSRRRAARARDQGRIMCEKKPDGLSVIGTYPVPPVQVQLLPEDEERHQPEPEDGRRDPEEDEPHRRPVGGRTGASPRRARRSRRRRRAR